MPVRFLAQHGGDIAGGVATGIATTVWLGNLNTIVSILLGIAGIVGMLYSIRLNMAKYKELKKESTDD